MELQAPSVVAIVVSEARMAELLTTLRSLQECDYPNLSILVVDTNDCQELENKIADVAPDAFVRSGPAEGGYAEVVNEAVAAVEGAAFLWLARVGTLVESDAISVMVQEAFRSNAGVVAPKILDGRQPGVLLSVGLFVDRAGIVVNRLEPGELDQRQHDSVKEVFAADGAAMLVRADLFSEVGGLSACFGPEYVAVEFCWRARLAGAKVVVAPEARVEMTGLPSSAPKLAKLDIPDPADRSAQAPDAQSAITTSRLDALTATLMCSQLRSLPVALLSAAAGSTLETVAGLGTGHPERLREEFRAWSGLIGRVGELRRGRRRIKRIRVVGDSQLAPVRAAGVHLGRSAVRAGVDPRGLRLVLATAVLLVLEFYAVRGLWSGSLPHVGAIVSATSSSTLWGQFLAGWRSVGLGSASSLPPPGLAVAALLGWLTLGHPGIILRAVLVFGLPLGTVGIGRAARAIGLSGWTRFIASVAYAACVLPYDAGSAGSISAMAVFALLPWFLEPLLRYAPTATRGPAALTPVGNKRGSGRALSGRMPTSSPRRLLVQAILLAVAGALFPCLIVTYAVLVVGWAFGLSVSAVVHRSDSRAKAAVLHGCLVLLGTLVLLLPGVFGELVSSLGRPGYLGRRAILDLFRFHVGPLGAGPIGFGLVVAAVPILAFGLAERRETGFALWLAALVSVGAALALVKLGLFGAGSAALLVPAAEAWSLSVGLGAASFRRDLPNYGFGWRQGLAVLGAAALVVSTLPVLTTLPSGRLDLPRAGMTATLSSAVGATAGPQDFRVLWLGRAQALSEPYWRLSGNVMFGIWNGATASLADWWPGPITAAEGRVREFVLAALAGRTDRLGHLLSSPAIRYIAISLSPAPADDSAPSYPLPPAILSALESQSDLVRVPADPDLIVFQNEAAFPLRAELGAAANIKPSEHDPRVLQFQNPQVGSSSVLAGPPTAVRVSGPLAAGRLFVSEVPGWQLDAGGTPAPRRPAFSFGEVFAVSHPGQATLEYPVSGLRWLALVVEGLLWLAGVVYLTWPLVRRAAPKEMA